MLERVDAGADPGEQSGADRRPNGVRVATRDVRRPAAKMAQVPSDDDGPSGIAHTTSPEVETDGSRSGQRQRADLQTGPAAQPGEDRAPTPSTPGRGARRAAVCRRARPRTSRNMTGRHEWVAEDGGDRRRRARGGEDGRGGRVTGSLGPRFTASSASPPPSAMSGASGPTTAPPTRLAPAARTTPGSAAGGVAPSPSPRRHVAAVPGSRVTASATTTPASPMVRIGHQAGSSSYPSSLGSVSQTRCWSSCTAARKANATSESGIPSPAANSKIVR